MFLLLKVQCKTYTILKNDMLRIVNFPKTVVEKISPDGKEKKCNKGKFTVKSCVDSQQTITKLDHRTLNIRINKVNLTLKSYFDQIKRMQHQC
jgi:hypothetical protein